MSVGIHSGTIVAGVVGKMKFAYDLFGNTINSASRIQPAGEVRKMILPVIHVESLCVIYQI